MYIVREWNCLRVWRKIVRTANKCAFNFYRSVFGGEFKNLTRFKDTPEAARVQEKEKDKLMHVALPVGKGNALMATDTLDSFGQKLVPGNNFYLSIEADSKDEAQKIFRGLSAGGTVTMPLQDTFWGYFGMINDRFGIRWMVNHMPAEHN